MKKITESELKNKVLSLKEKMAVVEGGATNPAAQQQAAATGQPSAATNLATGVGDALGTAAGVVAAPARAVWDAAKGVWNHAGEIGQGIAKGWDKTDPATMVGLDKTTPATTQGTKPPGKSDPAVLKQQQDLIAKGAKIKADGIMGPATQAAMKQFGGQAAAPAAAPTGTTAPAAPAGDAAKNPANQAKPAPAATPAAATSTSSYAASAPPVGGTTDPVTGQYTVTDPSTGGSTTYVSQNNGTILSSSPSAGAPALNTTTTGLTSTNNVPITNNAGVTTAAAPAAAPAGTTAPAAFDPTGKTLAEIQDARNKGLVDESVSFRNDELSRILTLIHHR